MAQTNQQILFDRLFIPGLIANNPINDIKQDRFGLMWFSTNDGLHRFDGYNFETYSLQLIEEPSTFQKMLFINDSIMIVSARHNGLLRFNYLTGSYKQFYNNTNYPNPIDDIVQDGEGTLWVDKGLSGLYRVVEDSLELISKDTITALNIAPNGQLHFATHNRLKEIRNGQVSIVGSIDKTLTINAIAYNGSNIWLGTRNDGVYEIGSTGVVKLLDLNGAAVKGFFQDKNLNIWVMTNGRGLFLYDKGSFKVFKRQFYNENSISSDRILSVFQDSNDIIWVGTASGINKYDPFKFKFEIYQHQPLNDSSLSSNLVRGIYEDNHSNIWIATEDGTINKLDSTKSFFTKRKIESAGQKVVPYDFYELNEKEMLVASSHGLWLVDKNLSSYKKYFDSNHSLADIRIRSITKYKNDSIILLSRGKLFLLNLKTNELSQFTIRISQGKPSRSDQAVDFFARTVYTDKNGTLWVGSYGTIAKVNLNKKTADYYKFSDGRGSMVMYINKIDSNLWLGTFNGGLIKLNAYTKKFTTYKTENGLPNNTVYAAIPDNSGNLWVSTNDGLSRFNMEKESFTNYNTNDGLQGPEFNRLAFIRRFNGEIVLGGINGFNIFQPESIKPNPHAPRSVLLNAEILTEFEDNNNFLHPKRSLIGVEQLNLSHQQNFLRFNFSTMHYSAPDENKFYYQLENYDNNWIYAGTKNTATYTGLNYGHYTFKVKAVSPDGIEEPNYAAVNISIDAPFWMHWWFYTIIFLGLVLIGYTVVQHRVNRAKQVKLMLEKEIKKRTKELKASKDELGDLNQKKDFIFSILSHDLRSPLTTLEGFLGLLIKHYDKMEPEEIKTHAEAIKNSVGKSLDLIDNTLYWSLSQMGNITFNPITISIASMFERVKGLYELTANKKNITLEFDMAPDLKIYADDNMAYIIVRNLVSNAIKFSPPEENIKILAKREGDMVAITIIDHGEGISPGQIDTLFNDQPNKSKTGTSNEKGAGLGLVLCKKFIDMNNGNISVKSGQKGSAFKVEFPTGN